jgi:hypothetical protein
MPSENERKPRGGRTLGLIVASTMATTPSLGCGKTADPTANVETPSDAAADTEPTDTAASPDEGAVAMDATTGTDADDDAVDAYPDGIRG